MNKHLVDYGGEDILAGWLSLSDTFLKKLLTGPSISRDLTRMVSTIEPQRKKGRQKINLFVYMNLDYNGIKCCKNIDVLVMNFAYNRKGD